MSCQSVRPLRVRPWSTFSLQYDARRHRAVDAPYAHPMSTDHAPSASDCLFCKIIARQIPADIVHETPTTLAFRDIKAQAPTHVLVIPKEHQPNVVALGASWPQAVVERFEAVDQAHGASRGSGLDRGLSGFPPLRGHHGRCHRRRWRHGRADLLLSWHSARTRKLLSGCAAPRTRR